MRPPPSVICPASACSRLAAEERGAIAVFERLGFKAEALLADYVMDRDGRTHDLIVMSHDVTGLNE